MAPALCARMHETWQRGDAAGAAAINDRLVPLHRALFLETSPAPVKYACSVLGKSTPDVRLPLVETTDATKAAVEGAMRHAGILN